ncbi:MAG: NAD(P)H-binding protein [Armatimonadetes bacterium]|nr:NAD(P)H-binding protein [Armatimonadota bacterium]
MIAVTGAGGFIGQHLLDTLRQEGLPARAVVRRPQALPPEAGAVDVAAAEVGDPAALEAAFRGCRAVVHLVAVIRERGAATFEAVNRLGARHVATAARAAGVARLVHVSALGARPDQRGRYLASKWRGEEEIRAGGVPWVILRPSFVFGPGGGAMAQFAAVVRYGPWYPVRQIAGRVPGLEALASLVPVVPVLGSGQYRSMPVDVRDLCAGIAQALTRDGVTDQTFELGGPEVVPYDDLIRLIARTLGVRRALVHVPLPVAWGIVRASRLLPDPPITPDEFEAILEDNLCDNGPALRAFALRLRPLAETVAWSLGIA